MLTYQILDHGCDGEQFFPGCGVAFTKYEACVTGIGDSAREAGEDALEQFHTSLDREKVTAEEAARLEEEICDLSGKPSFDPAEVNDEWHHYVSIRWKVE
jgi:hypothetical protein